MDKVKIENNHVTYLGVRYFTKGADTMMLGAYGEKRTPLVGANGLDAKDRLAIPKLKKIRASKAEIELERLSKNDFGMTIHAVVNGIPTALSAAEAYEQVRTHELTMVHIYVPTAELEDAINADAHALRKLASYGPDARVVSDVLVSFKAEAARQFEHAVDVSLEVGKGPLDFVLHNGHTTSGNSSVTWSSRLIFAYKLQKLDWNRGKTHVLDLDSDEQGR